MVDIKSKKGLVAFFDILGYSQLLTANKVEDVAQLIVNTLAKIPLHVIEGLSVNQSQLTSAESLETYGFQDKFWGQIIGRTSEI